MVSVKVKFALVLLAAGMVLGICAGYGIFRLDNFDLMVLLMFIFLCIWAIRKRKEEKVIEFENRYRREVSCHIP